MECEYCQEASSPSHQCLSLVLKTLQEIEEEQERQTMRLEKLQSQAKHLLNYNSLSKNLHMFRGVQHIGTGCSGCNETPIIGIRFKCKQCVNFELCCKCRDTFLHPHSDFFILSVSGVHEINCDVCNENVGEIRYICRECSNMNFCHKCVVSISHPHLVLENILPLVISVEVFPKKNLIYAVGEEAVVHILVCNMSVQPISNLTLKITSGEVPFQFSPTFFDFSLNVGCKKTILLKGTISKEPGNYVSTFRLYSEQYEEWVGTDIVLNIKVTIDYLEGLKQSLSL
jgi:Zinc finger, ZZ type